MNKHGKLDEKFRAGPGSRLAAMDSLAESVDEENLCQLCCSNDKSVVLLPCQHDGICEECVTKFDTCPFCREVVRSWHKGYSMALAEDAAASERNRSASSSKTSFSLYHDVNSTPTALAPPTC